MTYKRHANPSFSNFGLLIFFDMKLQKGYIVQGPIGFKMFIFK